MDIGTHAYLIESFNGTIKRAEEAKQSMIRDLTDMGPCYAVKWAEKYMKREQAGRVAANVLNMVNNEMSWEEIRDELEREIFAQISYMIPSNSDHAEKLYYVQESEYALREIKSALK